MASLSNVSKLTQNPSPTRPPRHERTLTLDAEMGSCQSEDDIPYTGEVSPFTTTLTAPHQPFSSPPTPYNAPPTVPSYSAPSLRSLYIDTEIKTTTEVEDPGRGMRREKRGVKLNEWETQEQNVFLTWENVSVTGSDGTKRILQGLTGYAEPGQVLAIMGPSGCGKSTLLDSLAGRLGSNTKQSGDILINGRRQRLASGTSEGWAQTQSNPGIFSSMAEDKDWPLAPRNEH